MASRSSAATGSGRNKSASATVTTAVAAPMPIASVISAIFGTPIRTRFVIAEALASGHACAIQRKGGGAMDARAGVQFSRLLRFDQRWPQSLLNSRSRLHTLDLELSVHKRAGRPKRKCARAMDRPQAPVRSPTAKLRVAAEN